MRIALFASVVAFGLACNLTGPGDFSHAVATFRCGPADGAETSILLARKPIESLQPSYPFVNVIIAEGVGELPGRTLRLDSGLGSMSAHYFPKPGRVESAVAGSVRIDRVGPDNRVEGRVELQFPLARVADDFSAPWVESLVICG